jgi:hypothetical protein
MSPVTFICRDTLPQTPQEIGAQILDLSQWPKFQGYGPLPGIKSAEFEVRTPDVVGTRIRVVNTDGSTHVEEIIEWWPDRRIQLRMDGFSPPLCRLATHIVETWQFTDSSGATAVTRSFELHPKSHWTKPAVWLIARLLKLAVQHHLRDLRRAGAS